jgi:hypothetical protein
MTDQYAQAMEGGEGGEGSAVTADGQIDLVAVQKKWLAVVERHEKKRTGWLSRAEKIVKLYADTESTPTQAIKRKYPVLWANVQTLGPAVYSRAPKCVVSRRFQTPNEDVRNAVIGLERATNIAIADGGLHQAIMAARQDRLLAARGTIWIDYEAQDDGQQITSQTINAHFVPFTKFGHGEGRVWEEVDCAWRETYFTDEMLKKRFGDDVMERAGVSLDYAEKDAPDDERQATVYQIWCKSRKAVYWIAKNAREALAVTPPPLDLKNFWPFPKPVLGTVSNDSIIPTPDYVYYQDQAEEIQRLTRRIDKLTDSLKLVGFYPGGPSGEGRAEVERAMTPGVENKLIPVPNWAALSEKGGAGNLIVYLPIDQVIKTIEACVQLRKQLIEDIYQITGLSDVMRGQTEAQETATAQSLKAQYGSNRLKDTRDDFVRFAKEGCEIFAEIVAEHYTTQKLAMMTSLPAQAMQQVMGPQGPQVTQQPAIDPMTGLPLDAGWVKLLRQQFARDVLVDVETDSTIQPDEDAEKQRRVEFMTTMTQAMAPLMSMQTMDPMMAKALIPLVGDSITFLARGFRAGRELEERIETSMQELVQAVEAKAQQMQMQQMQQAQMQQAEQQQQGIAADREAQDAQHRRQIEGRKLDLAERDGNINAAAKLMTAQARQAMPPAFH